MATLADITVDYTILRNPAPTLTGDLAGWSADMTFGMLWSDRGSFLDTVAGTVEVGPDGAERIVPLIHPDYPGLLAQAVRVEGAGGPHNEGYVAGELFSHARVTVGFGTAAFPLVGDQPYMTIRRRFGGEYITIPHNWLWFDSDDTPIDHDAGVFVPQIGYQISIYLLPEINDTLVESLTGKVNSATFLGRAVGTVRFDGLEDEQQVTLQGKTTYTVSYAFMYRRRPWNQILRPDGTWEAPVHRGTAVNLHESADLNALIEL